MPTLTAEYLDDLARVRLEAGDLVPGVVYTIDRSDDGGATWETVRGATSIGDGGVTIVYDYEYTPNVENLYRLTQPLVSDRFERESVTGAGDYDESDPAVAPGVTAPGSGLLISSWTSGYQYDGDFTIPVSMAELVQQSGSVTNAVATEAVAAGPTGDRSASAGVVNAWSAVSVLIPGTGVAIEDAQWAHTTTGDPTVTTAAAEAGWWLVAVAATDWDGSDEMGPPTDGQPWELVADTTDQGSVEISSSRTMVWAREVTDAGPQTVGVADTPSSTDNFLTVMLLSGAAVAPTGWGSADTGQTWQLYDDSGDGEWSVSGGAGRVVAVDSGVELGRYVDGDFTDIEAVCDLIVTEGLEEFFVHLRGGTSTTTGYAVVVEFDSSGTVELALRTNGSPGAALPIGSWQSGQRWRVKARCVGAVLEARAWNTANPEPSTWQVVATSTGAASGTVGVGVVLDAAGDEALVDDVFVHGVPPSVVATAEVTPEQDDVWLKSVAFPSLNVNLGCVLTGERTRRSRVGLFDVKGRHAILGIADVGSTETFTITFHTESPEANTAVTGLLTFGAPLLLQSPPDDDPTGCGPFADYPSGWFMPGDSTQIRPLPGRRVWEWQVPLTRVAPPAAHEITPAHMTWSVLWQMVTTWTELWSEWATWAELWDADVAPQIMVNALSGGEAL